MPSDAQAAKVMIGNQLKADPEQIPAKAAVRGRAKAPAKVQVAAVAVAPAAPSASPRQQVRVESVAKYTVRTPKGSSSSRSDLWGCNVQR